MLKLESAPPIGPPPFITDTTIRLLIDGSSRSSRPWRSDDEFYETYVKPTFRDRAEWESWSIGAWRPYWFAFWSEIRDFYNEQAQQERNGRPLWTRDGQTNLTKAVTLRLLQRLFMQESIKRVEQTKEIRDVLVEELGEEAAERRVAARVAERALPSTPEAFRDDIRQWFLERGIPVRVFLRPWVKSLDDPTGQEALFRELEKAYTVSQKGERYHARNKEVYDVGDEA